MNPEIKASIYKLLLNEPTLTQREIANRVGVHESEVSKAIKKTATSVDYQLAMQVAGKFLQDFQKASDFWKLQVTELEQMKGETDDVGLKVKIMREQSDRYEKILFQARQGELVEGLRLINKGMIPLKNKQKELSHNIKKTI